MLLKEVSPDGMTCEEIVAIKMRLKGEFSKTCPAPWTSLVVQPEGYFSPCCWTPHDSRFNIHDYASVEEIWNSEYYLNLRKLISQNRYDEANCSPHCVYLGGKTEAPFDPGWVMGAFTDEFIASGKYKDVEKDFLARKQTSLCAAPPSILMTTLFYNCNLDCTICIQKDVRSRPNKIDSDTLSLLLARSDALSTWNILGGEVFLDKRFIEFLTKFEARKQPLPKIVIVTNGTLLDEKNLSKITSSRFPFLVFSIDGATADTYNRIRVGSDFDTVMTNLKRVVDFYRRNGKEGSILWHYVLMKSTLEELEIAHDICEDLGVLFDIDKVMGVFPEENIFDFPYMLADSSGVDIALRFLKGNKISNGFRKSSLIIELEGVAAKLAKLDTFLTCPPREAAGMLGEAELMSEVANAASSGARKTEVAERLPEILLNVREIPEDIWSQYLVLLNFIPSGAKDRNEVLSHVKSLLPDRVSASSRFDNSFRDITSVMELLYDKKVGSTANYFEIIHGMTLMMITDTGDGTKGSMTGDEALGASLSWGHSKLNGDGILYEFMDRYMDETVLNWDNVTPSWRLLIYNLASWRENVGKVAEAAWLFERLLDLPDMDRMLLSGCHFHLARMAKETGDMDKACLSAGKCLMINPQHIAAAELINMAATNVGL